MSTTLPQLRLTITQPKPAPVSRTHKTTPTPPSIRCGAGPRSNRGPLVKGRILSTQAILAIQSLKRAQTSPNPSPSPHLALTRLTKPDLLATLRELLRQDQCALALQVLSIIRSEPWYSTDFSLYADIVLALTRSKMPDHIDELVEAIAVEVESGVVVIKFEDKGLRRLVRALVQTGRKEATVRVYEVMKRLGWGRVGSGVEVDEYLSKVLSRGFRRFGEVELAMEVELCLEDYLNACLGRPVDAELAINGESKNDPLFGANVI